MGDRGGASLADYGDLDLAGVLQCLLDALGDVACEACRANVVDGVRPYDDLATMLRLYGALLVGLL